MKRAGSRAAGVLFFCPAGRQCADILGRRVVRRPSGTGFLASERLASPVAVHVHFEDRRVMHDTIDRGEGHGGILEDFAPLSERLIRGNYVELAIFFGGLTCKAPEAPVYLNS